MRRIFTVLVILTLGLNKVAGQNDNINMATTQNTNRSVNAAIVLNKSLQFLKNNQNPDGSWATDPKSFVNTSLAISAFLRIGETRTSEKYGATISSAHEWLLKARPSSMDDRIAIAVALSDYYTLHADTPTAGRVAALLEETNGPISAVWSDIISTTRLPDEAQRPKWCSSQKEIKEKYEFVTNNILPMTASDYLSTFTAGRIQFRSGGNAAAEHCRFLKDKIFKRQRDDGSFFARTEEDRIATTALVVLSLADLNHGAYQFYPQKPHKDSKSVDQEIKVNL